MDPEVAGNQETRTGKILEEVPSLTRRHHDAVVTTGLARQCGALPTEGRPSLSLLTGNTSDSVPSTLSPRLLAPREAEFKETEA